ncbi:MAG TPA: hypothetical protein VMZ06_01125, partial [Candidatus Bathyarchaeia archaeon]|nr:hypothetical protein [Candidatus Bathyarchaeia archaeon]
VTADGKGDPAEMRDERRVAYVAYTRAIGRLELHYRRVCDQNPKRITSASRFITEAGLTV